jgi:hypothetical protein
MKVTACECVEPGWCARHRCHKSRFWFQVCRRQPEMFALWERGQGPGQQPVTLRNPVEASRCRHLGLELREQACPDCRGAVRLKVFRCPLHTECTLQRPIASLACCATCTDYAPPEPGGLPVEDRFRR